ncbi:hypothetical protein FOA52_013438 [Chlamydomonas sp. UWO 241]|nr:hypothetical protein FOA52_013438 [Chlamydomonas sp. UWO 241]
MAGHHAPLLFVYMKLLVYLQDTFEMPDVDFVISTVDRPLSLSLPPSSTDHPVMRFCKTDSNADVLIPITHFHSKGYDRLLDLTPALEKTYPWPNRTNRVFGRFSPYTRHANPLDPSSPARLGASGVDICARLSSRVTRVCDVRTHFSEWCQRPEQRADFDVRIDGFVTMEHHASFKYLVHLDGQGLSSRLDQLLPLKAMVMKEESGYRAFYHHLLKPHVHYVPFWKERPDDALQVLAWARSNDAKARTIGEAGQALALKYLNARARACYWYHLLLEYSKLHTYTPGRGAGLALLRGGPLVRVSEYLATTAEAYEGGKHIEMLRKWAP